MSQEKEITLDFGKIKNIFKKQENKEKDETIIEVDKTRVVNIIKKYNILLLLLIPIFLSIFFRAYTYTLPITQDWAEQSVYQNIKAQIEAQINAESPSISPQAKSTLVDQRFQQVLIEERETIKVQIEAIQNQIRANYQDPEGRMYLPDIDTYFYHLQVQNLLDHGHVGDRIVNNKPYDDHSIAPIGREAVPNFNSYVIAGIYKFLDIFTSPTITQAMFIMPMLIAALSVIPTFFLARKIGGNAAGFFAATILAIATPFLGRSGAGFADTDVYNVFFPVLILWIFIEALTAKKQNNQIMLGTLAGVLTGLYSFVWIGWWYLLDFMLATIGLYALYLMYEHRKEIKTIYKTPRAKTLIFVGLSFFLLAGITSAFLGNFQSFYKAPISPLLVNTIQSAAKPNLWPNVYTTVAELNPINFTNLVNQLGGNFYLLIALGGIILTIITHRKGIGVFYSIFLILWFFGMAYTSTKGIRFLLLVVPPFAIAFGICLGILYEKGATWIASTIDLKKSIIKPIIIVLLLLLFIQPLQAADAMAKNQLPNFDDVWYNTLTKIKETTPEESILTSWWDFGHWFKAVADRRVTFDGASQNSPQAHWIGKALRSDEETAYGIIRMLDCGANQAFNKIDEQTNDTLKSVEIINEIILGDREKAKESLEERGIINIEEILNLTHCSPPPNYIIASEDMIGKSGVWTHFGGWDFKKAFIYQTVKTSSRIESIQIIQEELGYTQEQAFTVVNQVSQYEENEANNWVSPFIGYSDITGCSRVDNETLFCSNGAMINTTTNEVTLRLQSGEVIHPKKYSNGEISITYEDSPTEFGVGYNPNTNMAFFAETGMVDSLFAKMFFFEGKGLTKFELVDHQKGFNDFDIYVYKVKWEE